MIYLIIFICEIVILFVLSRKVTKGISTIIFRITKNEKTTIIISAILFLPGTFIHEISHFLTALFLLVPVRELNITPKIIKNDEKESILVKMGSVSVAKTDLIRSSIIGLAPFILGITIISLSTHLMQKYNLSDNWVVVIFFTYLIFQISNTMFSSRKDLKAFAELLILLSLGYILFSLIGLKISLNVDGFQNIWGVEYLKNIVIYLLIPVILDFILTMVMRLFVTK